MAGLGACWPGLAAAGTAAASLTEPALAPAAGAPAVGVPTATHPHSVYVAARKNGPSFEAAVFDARGRDLYAVGLDDRGHSFALDPASGRAVAFGRQPGFFATAFQLDGSSQPVALEVAQDRHFFGHGVFVDEARLLLATENDYEAGRGVLGVYDASSGGAYRRVGEFASGGVGPHEVVALPGTNLVVVANGGILTHPDYGKMSLNLNSMQPSLTYIDISTGEIVETVTLAPEWHQLSIRHMTVDAASRVWFGCQYMGPAADMPPLVGCHQRGQAARMFGGSSEVLRSMRNYVGSVAVDAAGAIVATSSPVGGLVAYWETATGKLLGTTALADGCGVAPADEGGFLISSGEGALVKAGPAAPGAPVLPAAAGMAWDNHMRRVVLA